MAAVNFMIDSDFKWVLLGMALFWATRIAMAVGESAELPKAAVALGSVP